MGVDERMEAVEEAGHDRLEGKNAEDEESEELEHGHELVQEIEVQDGCLGVEINVRPDERARIAGGRTDSGFRPFFLESDDSRTVTMRWRRAITTKKNPNINLSQSHPSFLRQHCVICSRRAGHYL